MVGAELEQGALVRGSPPVSAWSRRGAGWGSVEPADVALELRAGNPATAADVHREEVAGLYQGVDRGAAESQDPGCLLGSQEQLVAGRQLPRSLRGAHFALHFGVRNHAPAFGAARPTGEGANLGRLVTVLDEVPVFLQSLLFEHLISWGRRPSSCSVT